MPLSSFPLGILNNYPRLRTGLQMKQGAFAYLLDLEYGNNALVAPAQSPYIYCGFRPEVQYHFEYYSRGSVYTGLEIAFSYAEKCLGRGTYRSTDGVRYQFDDAVQKRVKTTAIVKIGGIQEIGKRFYADFYFGFGLGTRNINYLNQLNPIISQIEPTEEWFSSSDLIREGNERIGAIALGCRIGYKLGKKYNKQQ
jgi:hypothetical protein